MMLSGVGETITQITPLPPIHETVVVDPIHVGSDGVNVYHPINPAAGGDTIIYAGAPSSNPLAGLSTATGLSGTTLMLLAGGVILFFAMKKT